MTKYLQSIHTVCNDQRMQYLSSWDDVYNFLCIINHIYSTSEIRNFCDDKSSWSFYRVSSILYIRVVIFHHVLSSSRYCAELKEIGDTQDTHKFSWKPSTVPGTEIDLNEPEIDLNKSVRSI